MFSHGSVDHKRRHNKSKGRPYSFVSPHPCQFGQGCECGQREWQRWYKCSPLQQPSGVECVPGGLGEAEPLYWSAAAPPAHALSMAIFISVCIEWEMEKSPRRKFVKILNDYSHRKFVERILKCSPTNWYSKTPLTLLQQPLISNKHHRTNQKIK